MGQNFYILLKIMQRLRSGPNKVLVRTQTALRLVGAAQLGRSYIITKRVNDHMAHFIVLLITVIATMLLNDKGECSENGKD